MGSGRLSFFCEFWHSFLDDHGEEEYHRRCATNDANLDMNSCIFASGGGLQWNHCVCDTDLCNTDMADPSSGGNKIFLGPILIASLAVSFAL